MNTVTYMPPLDKLLTYAVLDPDAPDTWPNYLDLGIGPEHIPDLIQMATDSRLRSEDASDLEFSAPVHAVRTLGQLHTEAAIEPLLPLFKEDLDNEWMMEDLPVAYGMIGPSAIPALAKYVSDTDNEGFPLAYASNALVKIANAHPEVREECIHAISKRLELFEQNDYEVNAFLIADLLQLKAVEVAPLIESAFAADRVDEGYVGDWNDVQVALGLKKPEEVPPRPRITLAPFAQERNDFVEPSSSRTSNKSNAAKKAKNKMAKASRKKNRRKK